MRRRRRTNHNDGSGCHTNHSERGTDDYFYGTANHSRTNDNKQQYYNDEHNHNYQHNDNYDHHHNDNTADDYDDHSGADHNDNCS